jgi:outer membrane protein insertion porin family/translocation and assembly module TamA
VTRALLLALGSAFCAATFLPPSAAGQQDEARGRPEVVAVRIDGNQTFATDSLKRAIINRETDCRASVLKLTGFCALHADFALTRHYFQAAEFPRDAIRLRLYYWQRGYREAQVDTTSSLAGPDQIELGFRIREGRPVLVDSIAIVGADSLPGADRLQQDLPLSKGDPLSMIAVQATRDSLETRLHDAGYAHALVLLNTSLPSASYSAGVTFDVDPGPRARFGTIDIAGNNELDDDVIRRMLGFREGQTYPTSRLLDAQRNLFGLELIQYARVDTLPTLETDTLIPVHVQIDEGDEYRVRGGAGWSQSECLSSEARWTARNFFGGARRLQVRGRLSNVLAESLQTPFCNEAGVGDYGKLNYLASVDFNQPWIFSPRNSLSLGLFGERTSLKDLFVREAVGANVSFVRSLGRATPLSLSYRPQLSRLSAAEVFFCTSFLACEPADIEILQSANWLSPLGVNASTDQTDNLLNPRAGYRAVLDLEHAARWTGSDYTYDRALGEMSRYVGIYGSTVIAGRLRAGWVGPGQFAHLTGAEHDVVHPQKRFFAGGANSVRGYAQNRLGPKVLTAVVNDLLMLDTSGTAVCTVQQVIALTCDASGLEALGRLTPQPTGGTRLVEGSVEGRFALGRPQFEGVGFVDFGQVWAEGHTPKPSDLVWTPGVGVRYYSAIGPLRLDIGYRPSPGETLSVVTSQVQACTRPVDSAYKGPCIAIDGKSGPGFQPIGQLALLKPQVLFDDQLKWWRRLQVHFSIGQAF